MRHQVRGRKLGRTTAHRWAMFRNQLQSLVEHERIITEPRDAGSARSRARRLALSLIECGDGFDETERQLDQWKVPEPVAAEAVNWAWERHRIAAEHGGPEAA